MIERIEILKDRKYNYLYEQKILFILS